MNSPFAVLASIVLGAAAIPIMISVVSYKGIDIPNKIQTNITHNIKDNVKKEINYDTVDKKDPVIKVYNTKLQKIQSISIEDYLCGVVAGEMPSDFEIEALKAQAVAARTFVIYREEQPASSKDKGAAVCTDYKHCQEYKSYEELKKIKGEEWMKTFYPKVKQAVSETKGQIITYNDKPILTLYFSTSAGKTENSEEVFSANYPYLKSVDSPYDKNYSPRYTSNLIISNKDFTNILKKNYSDIQITESNLSSQIKILKRSEGGSVEDIKLGNKQIAGTNVRSLLKLNSANFEIKFNDNYLEFIVKGYGHGVGMSQWGAQGMAIDGNKYYEILEHYYTGTKIKDTY
ncbi:stage II sporulation protein D [Romboutsia sp.]|uniref:stage II sporulation protein D n=1 Tax=Romboutsia sp. TaxID=1965302 RepID=UPI003F2B5B91